MINLPHLVERIHFLVKTHQNIFEIKGTTKVMGSQNDKQEIRIL